jgi:hypothetical protein
MRARIVPRVTQTFEARATIRNTKSTSIIGTFNVQAVRQVHLTGKFLAGSGYTGKQSFTSRANIAKRRVNRMTGYFLVTNPNTTKIQPYIVGFDSITYQTLKVGAGIVR